VRWTERPFDQEAGGTVEVGAHDQPQVALGLGDRLRAQLATPRVPARQRLDATQQGLRPLVPGRQRRQRLVDKRLRNGTAAADRLAAGGDEQAVGPPRLVGGLGECQVGELSRRDGRPARGRLLGGGFEGSRDGLVRACAREGEVAGARLRTDARRCQPSVCSPPARRCRGRVDGLPVQRMREARPPVHVLDQALGECRLQSGREFHRLDRGCELQQRLSRPGR
jgi:hypothetical protein